MARDTEHPILLVEPRKQDLTQREFKGFAPPKEIVKVTERLRRKLLHSIDSVADVLQDDFDRYPDVPSIITLSLHPNALAKTHRPLPLLERSGLRPIGTRKFGELLLPATPERLDKLAYLIKTNNSKVIRSNISTIQDMAAWGVNDTIQIRGDLRKDGRTVHRVVGDWIGEKKPFVIEKFLTNESDSYEKNERQLDRLLHEIGAELIEAKAESLKNTIDFVRLPSTEAAYELASFPGVRTLAPVDEFSPIEIEPQMFAEIGHAPDGILPPPQEDLPVVGVIDSGAWSNETELKPWITGTKTYVLPPETDYVHGTFVAGLVVGSKQLNKGNERFPSACAKVLDVAALATSSSTADELLLRIEQTVSENPEVKVWNCSFSTNHPGDPDTFGYFATALDQLSDHYGVLFVLAAGNYASTPRPWPPPGWMAGEDRIGQPAESLRALTVGSIAHEPALVATDEPSPFSRRGPGAAKTPKPDLTHIGGNCSESGEFVGKGVQSFIPGGKLGESVGTSFSTPLISALAANVWQALDAQEYPARPETVKGLLIHSAAVGSPIKKADEVYYYGFGVPPSIPEVLFCSPDTFTLMFDVELFDGIIWEKAPFPVPACLHPKGTHLRAEVVMTLVYAPPLDNAHGSEYVRANIDASFGSYDPDEDGNLHHHGLVPLEAPNKDDLYEKAMVEHGYKWSPIKVYHKIFTQGKAGRNFRLKLELLRRAGEPRHDESQKATVLLTFRGIEPDQPVYEDGLRAVHRANWTTNPIVHETRLRT